MTAAASYTCLPHLLIASCSLVLDLISCFVQKHAVKAFNLGAIAYSLSVQ